MRKLCERPGCSEPASVAYGMRPEDLVFWLDVLGPDADQSSGVLCGRHAESMVVPRHWTLDDLRQRTPTDSTVELEPVPWTPTFDDRDDLDGMLSATSPLLARAFRGLDRPRAG